MATPRPVVPLPLSGNITEQQDRSLKGCLEEAVQAAYRTIIDQLDGQSVEIVLETGAELKSGMTQMMVETIQRHMVSDKFKDEEVDSDRSYPSLYRARFIDDQVSELRKIFPVLGSSRESIARCSLPGGAEAWFAIPRWQALAPTYNEAVEMMIDALGSRRRFSNRLAGRLGPEHLRQTERSKLAESILACQQPGSDILVVAAQAGMLHRGSSARRTRVAMASNEFGLGVFAFCSMLLTHPERLSACETLMVDCGGDEYAVSAKSSFDRVPLFDHDLDGIEFSIFYTDRARDLWGTPTGFIYKIG